MLKKTITYTDYDGVERTEDYYFNLSKAELIEMELTASNDGMEAMIKQIVAAKDRPALFKTFKKILLTSVGVKSPDGKRFIKNDEIRDGFEQTEAYSELLVELISDDTKAANFINAIMPGNISDEDMAKAKLEAEKALGIDQN